MRAATRSSRAAQAEMRAATLVVRPAGRNVRGHSGPRRCPTGRTEGKKGHEDAPRGAGKTGAGKTGAGKTGAGKTGAGKTGAARSTLGPPLGADPMLSP